MYARVLALAGLVAITATAFAPAALPTRAPVRSYPLLACRVITLHSLVAKPANLQYRYVCMTSNILSHITQVEASETLVRELEAGQHCLKKTENADNKHITVAVKNIHNHGPHRGLRRIPKIWVCTNSLLTQRCDASMVIFGVSKNVVCVCESSTRQSAICLNCNPTTRHLLWKKTRIPLRFRWEKAPKYLENCKDT